MVISHQKPTLLIRAETPANNDILQTLWQDYKVARSGSKAPEIAPHPDLYSARYHDTRHGWIWHMSHLKNNNLDSQYASPIS